MTVKKKTSEQYKVSKIRWKTEGKIHATWRCLAGNFVESLVENVVIPSTSNPFYWWVTGGSLLSNLHTCGHDQCCVGTQCLSSYCRRIFADWNYFSRTHLIPYPIDNDPVCWQRTTYVTSLQLTPSSILNFSPFELRKFSNILPPAPERYILTFIWVFLIKLNEKLFVSFRGNTMKKN